MAGAAIELLTALATVPGMGYAGAALGVVALGSGLVAVVRLAIRDMAREAIEASTPRPKVQLPQTTSEIAGDVDESSAHPESEQEVCESV
jgi:hypothetical protein